MEQNDLVCRFDPQGKITFVNDAYCKCFGVTHQEILGTNFIPNIYKDDLELVKNHFEKLTTLKPQQTIEHRVILPSGEVRWQQWSGKAFYNQKGELLECQGVGRDITDLKDIQEKLREELQLRQLIIDALPGIALVIEHKTRKIVAANKAAAAIGAVPGSICYETWGRQKSPCSECLAAELLASSAPQNHQFRMHDRYWDIYWVPINTEQYLAYAIDITERQKDKEALKKIREELEKTVEQRTRELKETHAQLLHVEKLAAVGKLSASIAHEFNNPLQGIMTVLKEIERHAALNETEAELVGMAFKECERMRNLIASLRDFNRPSSGEIAPVNLHASLDSLLLLSKKEFDRHKITVEKDYAGNIPHIMAVHDQLKQVFLNLLGNAAHAGIEKKGKSKIQIRTEVAGEDIAIHIQDNGIGIQPEHFKHIFEPFFSTKPEQKGTGLGLSISYGIIKKHAGRIDVISKPGKGSTFSVYLPIKGRDQEEDPVL
jgi:PAS domain S-box-containing protein